MKGGDFWPGWKEGGRWRGSGDWPTSSTGGGGTVSIFLRATETKGRVRERSNTWRHGWFDF